MAYPLQKIDPFRKEIGYRIGKVGELIESKVIIRCLR